ncbi:MAG: GNAT family N-acetyltransferase [Clostridiales bacterium]|nr:GNAT family N-acetyltransferase [Clostridiales bacterium]
MIVISQEYNISELEPESLKEALDLVWRVFLAYEAPDYNDEGIQEFKDFIGLESIRQKLLDDQFRIWVCCNKDAIVGVLAVKPPCHISLLFVDGKHHRKGIARSLFKHMVDYYRLNHGFTEITVNSSPYAKEAYQKLGFTDTKIEQTVNGIRFTPMRFLL